MQKAIALLLLILITVTLFSQETESEKKWGYKGYSGGMFVHTGYVQSSRFRIQSSSGNIEQQVKGATFGLGGKMNIYLNRYFRIGGEGYFSTCKYGKQKNSCRISWGGVTFDALYPVKKWAPFMGVTVGAGNAAHLIFLDSNDNNLSETPALYFKTPLVVVNPTIGVEFFASNRVSLIFKMDYILNVYGSVHSYPHGVRFYLGLHFYQKKP